MRRSQSMEIKGFFGKKRCIFCTCPARPYAQRNRMRNGWRNGRREEQGEGRREGGAGEAQRGGEGRRRGPLLCVFPEGAGMAEKPGRSGGPGVWVKRRSHAEGAGMAESRLTGRGGGTECRCRPRRSAALFASAERRREARRRGRKECPYCLRAGEGSGDAPLRAVPFPQGIYGMSRRVWEGGVFLRHLPEESACAGQAQGNVRHNAPA